jgi:ubiquinone/menaquinone biosynthesis C-methylase UbiE
MDQCLSSEIENDQHLGTASPWFLWLVRLGFHLLYNQFAWTYDAVAWVVSLGQWQDWGRTAVPFLKGPRVLGLAHGPGYLLLELAAAGFSATGYDLSPAMGRIAGRRLARHGAAVPLARGRAQTLPYPAGAFNSVVCTFPGDFALHAASLSEIGRVLAADGLFVLVPFASPIGNDLAARALKALYTGTRPRAQASALLFAQLQAAGFHSEVRWITLRRSRVMLIVNRLSQNP